MTKVCSESRDVINVYRSEGANSVFFIEDLKKLFDQTKEVLIVGDFNICFKKQKSHYVLQEIKEMGFLNCVKKPTHIAGGYIDYSWIYHPHGSLQKSLEVLQQCSYFTDHDMLWIRKVSCHKIFAIKYFEIFKGQRCQPNVELIFYHDQENVCQVRYVQNFFQNLSSYFRFESGKNLLK